VLPEYPRALTALCLKSVYVRKFMPPKPVFILPPALDYLRSVLALSGTCCAVHDLCPAKTQVLLNAFGRALKDSFPPARVAALRALVATVKHYDANEVALRAMPAVSPLCIDPLAGKHCQHLMKLWSHAAIIHYC
jgi:hypothetical protein